MFQSIPLATGIFQHLARCQWAWSCLSVLEFDMWFVRAHTAICEEKGNQHIDLLFEWDN